MPTLIKISNLKARILLFSLFYFLVLSSTIRAQEIATSVKSAYQEALNLNFHQSNELSQSAKDPYAIYVANLSDALDAYISDNSEKLNDQEDYYLDLVENLPDSLPEKGFLLAEIKIHWAFVNLKFGNYFSAFWSFKQAHSVINDNQERFPDYLPNQKSLGVLHTIFGSFPDNYKWVLSLFNLEGNVKKGLHELDMVIQSESMYTIESLTYKSLFQSFFLNQKTEAVRAFNNFDGELPHSIELIHAVLLIKNSQSEIAQKKLLKLEEQTIDEKVPLIHYFLGETYLQKLAYDNSITYYRKFIQSHHGENYLKDAWTKIAINQWLKGVDFKTSLEKAKNTGATNVEVDKNATSLIENEELPHKTLLKIRYSTDGGFFDAAKKIIEKTDSTDFTSESDQLEFIYRRARYLHKTDQEEQAIEDYKEVIEKGDDSETYFAPNSCLQLGYIYLQQKDTNTSIQYFNKAKSYKNHPYKYSIDKKAELELEQVGE